MTEAKACSEHADAERTPERLHRSRKDEIRAEEQAVEARMSAIRHKLLVLSGKGGVGKSTVAVNLAAALADEGQTVGLLDVDLHGPSVPKLLHIDGFPIHGSGESLHPVELSWGLKVMSIGLLLQSRDDAVIWRGPMKYKLIRQFLGGVEWGKLDYLVVDCPPGTGDEPLAIAEMIHQPDGAILVTTPQQLAVQDVRRSVRFCSQLGVPVVGIIENMSGFVCPSCGSRIDIFGSGGGAALAATVGVPFLGDLPLDPRVVLSGDHGRPFVHADPSSEASQAVASMIRGLLHATPKAATTKAPHG